MARKHSAREFALFCFVLALCAAAGGCRSVSCGEGDNATGALGGRFLSPYCRSGGSATPPEVPTELSRVDLPEYVIQPPDVLVIDAVRTVPLPPYHIAPLDALSIVVPETQADQPIAYVYPVSPEGAVDLGYTYGLVQVSGLTLEEAKKALEEHLKPTLKPGFHVSVGLAQSHGAQQIRGDHLVRADGRIALGVYGSVKVSGLTPPQARAAVEAYLSRFLLNPEISLDVSGFNSQVYYVITDGGGAGEQVIRLPLQGHETVLDAISQINGLSAVSSKCIWVARPSPGCSGFEEVLPVDWVGVTQHGLTTTNYQLAPGDRVYVKAQDLVTFDTYLARVISPFERVFGVMLLGNSTVRAYGPNGTANNGGL